MLQTAHQSRSQAMAAYKHPAELDERREPRHAVRLAARSFDRLRLAIDSRAAPADGITDIIVNDISHNGLSATMNGAFIAGERVTIDVPVIGPRDVEIRWSAGDRAGCRFVTALDDEELRAALRENATLAEYFPGLLDEAPAAQAGGA